MPSHNVRSSTAAKSSMPLPHMNALNPTTPRSASSASRSTLPGTRPPQSARSTCADPVTCAAFRSNAAASIVGGCAFSGMSTAVVAPPAASAAVPGPMPSQSLRPGSFRWTCASTTPGSTSSPLASISSRPPGSSSASARITPPSMPMSRRTRPALVTIEPFRTTSSWVTFGFRTGRARARTPRGRRGRRPRPRSAPTRRGGGSRRRASARTASRPG